MMEGRSRIRLSSVNWKGILIVLFMLVILESFTEISKKELNLVLARILGYIDFQNTNRFLSSTVKFLLPQLGVLIIWGNYFQENILNNSNVIFTRTRNIKKIIFQYVTELLIGVTGMVVMLEAIICFVYKMRGYYLENLYELIINVILYIVYINMILVIVNILSFFIPIMYSILIILSMELVTLELIYILKQQEIIQNIYYIIPISAVMWYENLHINFLYKLFWVFYLSAIIIVITIIGYNLIKKKEFLA